MLLVLLGEIALEWDVIADPKNMVCNNGHCKEHWGCPLLIDPVVDTSSRGDKKTEHLGTGKLCRNMQH